MRKPEATKTGPAMAWPAGVGATALHSLASTCDGFGLFLAWAIKQKKQATNTTIQRKKKTQKSQSRDTIKLNNSGVS